MAHLAAVAAGGAVGASLRWAFLVAFPAAPGAFPLTTLAENVLGALLLGLLAGLLAARRPRAARLDAFLTTGVLGSFTTFSAVAVDLVGLGGAGRGGLALLYAASSALGGLLAAAAGLRIGRRRHPAQPRPD